MLRSLQEQSPKARMALVAIIAAVAFSAILLLAACGGESTKEKCDPAYPTVCISPPPPDLDCNEISYRRFKVLSPDPHGFDRDGDGIGCESG